QVGEAGWQGQPVTRIKWPADVQTLQTLAAAQAIEDGSWKRVEHQSRPAIGVFRPGQGIDRLFGERAGVQSQVRQSVEGRLRKDAGQISIGKFGQAQRFQAW